MTESGGKGGSTFLVINSKLRMSHNLRLPVGSNKTVDRMKLCNDFGKSCEQALSYTRLTKKEVRIESSSFGSMNS